METGLLKCLENHKSLGRNFQAAIRRGWNDAKSGKSRDDCPYKRWKVGKSNFVRAWPQYWLIGYNAYPKTTTVEDIERQMSMVDVIMALYKKYLIDGLQNEFTPNPLIFRCYLQIVD